MEGWLPSAPGTAGKSRLELQSGRAETQFGKWVLLPEVQREPLPQERAAVVLSAGQSEQSLHFLCKDLREGGRGELCVGTPDRAQSAAVCKKTSRTWSCWQ